MMFASLEFVEWVASGRQLLLELIINGSLLNLIVAVISQILEKLVKKKNGLVDLQNHLLSDILNGFLYTIYDVDEGIEIIRKKLCRKKVLIALDDVNDVDQLDALAANDKWFGSGSRILITTRDESLLKIAYKECEIYKADHLNENEGLQLLSWKAFKSSHPKEEFTTLCKEVIRYAKGLPLAIKVIGSFLGPKKMKEWKSALDRLKEYPEKKIVEVLQITFEALEETEKSIFLDIACFFNGWDKDSIIYVMDGCHFFPEIGIRNLIDKSLLFNDSDNRLRMHDLLQEMAIEVIRGKCRNQPGRWSRLWNHEDISRVLNNNTGTEEVEAIVCGCPYIQCTFRYEALSNMKKLRLLMLWHHNARHFMNSDFTPPAYLSNELRILHWDGFPFTSFPSSFQPNQLVVLRLSGSKIEELWNNTTKPLYNLKIINLSGSENIRKLEDFKVVPNLEKLDLSGCSKLVEIHPSITSLTGLTLLDLGGCHHLENLPSISGLKSLKILRLYGCRSLKSLPKDWGYIYSLAELHLGTNLLIDSEPGEAKLNIIVGKSFFSLKRLNLRYCCLGDGAIPEDFGCLASLEELDLMGNKFSSLPASLNQLSKLRILELSACENLKSVGPELPPSLELVKVDWCTSLDTFLDPSNVPCNLNCSATCVECFDMVKRQGSKRTAFALLKRYLQNPPNPSRILNIVLPGNKIPAWFTNRSSGTSISIQLDPNWCNSKWRGFALSLCFVRTGWIFSNKFTDSHYWCDVMINGQDWGHGLVKLPIEGEIFEYHLWLLYLPHDIYFCSDWRNKKYSRIEFSFKTVDCQVEDYAFFGECGARLVYEEDIEDLNRIANESIE